MRNWYSVPVGYFGVSQPFILYYSILNVVQEMLFIRFFFYKYISEDGDGCVRKVTRSNSTGILNRYGLCSVRKG